VGLAAAALATAGVVLLAGSASSSVPLTSIDPRTLQEIGLTISPTASHSTISKARAEARASAAVNARGVRESVLANCRFGAATAAAYDGPCWVVSLLPAGDYSNGPPGSPRIAATYVLALVDPQSGELIRGFEGSGP
jgi:hypothetical protein